jgi:serine/threonine protein kinase
LDYASKLYSDNGHFVQVGDVNVDLANEDPVNGSLAGHVLVTLQLIPVGCKVYNMTPQRLLKLAKSILTTLVAIHEAGFVHRDVRQDNIFETQSGFCLIGLGAGWKRW